MEESDPGQHIHHGNRETWAQLANESVMKSEMRHNLKINQVKGRENIRLHPLPYLQKYFDVAWINEFVNYEK